jgi:hypothetical protein
MEGVNIEKLVPPEEVSGYWIAENAESAKAGKQESLARQLEGTRGLPNWIVSAMKTVMNCKLCLYSMHQYCKLLLKVMKRLRIPSPFISLLIKLLTVLLKHKDDVICKSP